MALRIVQHMFGDHNNLISCLAISQDRDADLQWIRGITKLIVDIEW